MIVYIIFALIIGLILGIVLTKKFEKKPKTFGDLVIFESTEPGEEPFLYVDWDMSPRQIYNEKYVIFKVSLK